MVNKSFFFGLLIGCVFIILVVLVLIAYSTSKILPQLEKESEDKISLFDKPILKISDLPNLRHLYDSGRIKNLTDPDRVYVINYWATWCSPCIEEMESFGNLSRKISGGNIEFLFISDEPFDKQITFISRKKWSFPFYKFNTDEYKENQIYPRKWPTTLVIKNNIVYLKVEQKYDWDSEIVTFFLNGLAKE